MRKTLCTLVALLVAAPAFAQNGNPSHGNGNGAPSGAHYTLNIVGVDNEKTAEMTDSRRRTIFVGLGGRGGDRVETRIYLVPGGEFQVCDGNGFDQAWDCDNQPIRQDGAVFQLPCNTNLAAENNPGNNNELEILIACDGPAPTLSYEVWARALGQPGGDAIVTTCAYVDDDFECSTENTVFVRNPGRTAFANVTQELTSLVLCYDVDDDPEVEDIDCFRYALFEGDFEDWFWNYDNNGLRLAQLRFYETD